MENLPLNTFALCYPENIVLIFQTKNGKITYAQWLFVSKEEVARLHFLTDSQRDALDIAQEKSFLEQCGFKSTTHRIGYFLGPVGDRICEVALAA